MDLDVLYDWGVLATFCLAGIAFPLLFWITVPYGGRHTSERWGPSLPSPVAWFLMEIPAPVCLLTAYSLGRHAGVGMGLIKGKVPKAPPHQARVDQARLDGGKLNHREALAERAFIVAVFADFDQRLRGP